MKVNKKYKYKIFFIISILMFFGLPVIINLIVMSKAPFGIQVAHDNDWIGFYGSLIGGLLTLVGVYVTIRFTKEEYLEQDRRKLLPYIDIMEIDEIEYTNLRSNEISIQCLEEENNENSVSIEHTIYFKIKNVGFATATHLCIKDITLNDKSMITIQNGFTRHQVLALNENLKFHIGRFSIKNFNDNSSSLRAFIKPFNTLNIVLSYKDLLGNEYNQNIKFNLNISISSDSILKIQQLQVLEINEPGLISRQIN